MASKRLAAISASSKVQYSRVRKPWPGHLTTNSHGRLAEPDGTILILGLRMGYLVMVTVPASQL